MLVRSPLPKFTCWLLLLLQYVVYPRERCRGCREADGAREQHHRMPDLVGLRFRGKGAARMGMHGPLGVDRRRGGKLDQLGGFSVERPCGLGGLAEVVHGLHDALVLLRDALVL